jgi:hypothetical protein
MLTRSWQKTLPTLALLLTAGAAAHAQVVEVVPGRPISPQEQALQAREAALQARNEAIRARDAEREAALAARVVKSTEARVYLQDAPTRSALEMLFMGAGANYSIGADVKGFVTTKIALLPLPDQVKVVTRFASRPLEYTENGGVFQVKAAQAESNSRVRTPEPNFAPAGHATYQSVADVPRRVCGIRFVRPERLDPTAPPRARLEKRSAAILVTGQDGPNSEIRIVQVGDKVPDGLPTRAGTLTVFEITSKDIVLITADQKEIIVPLKQAEVTNAPAPATAPPAP